jgi:hypothetical protein
MPIPEKKSDNFSKAKFNIGLKILEIIGDRLQRAISKYASGNLVGWFFELKAIKMVIVAKIPEQSKLNLKNKEKCIADLIITSKKSPSKNKQALAEEIENYNEQIQTVLLKLGIDIPQREARHLLFGQDKEIPIVNPEEEFTGM